MGSLLISRRVYGLLLIGRWARKKLRWCSWNLEIKRGWSFKWIQSVIFPGFEVPLMAVVKVSGTIQYKYMSGNQQLPTRKPVEMSLQLEIVVDGLSCCQRWTQVKEWMLWLRDELGETEIQIVACCEEVTCTGIMVRSHWVNKSVEDHVAAMICVGCMQRNLDGFEWFAGNEIWNDLDINSSIASTTSAEYTRGFWEWA